MEDLVGKKLINRKNFNYVFNIIILFNQIVENTVPNNGMIVSGSGVLVTKIKSSYCSNDSATQQTKFLGANLSQ